MDIDGDEDDLQDEDEESSDSSEDEEEHDTKRQNGTESTANGSWPTSLLRKEAEGNDSEKEEDSSSDEDQENQNSVSKGKEAEDDFEESSSSDEDEEKQDPVSKGFIDAEASSGGHSSDEDEDESEDASEEESTGQKGKSSKLLESDSNEEEEQQGGIAEKQQQQAMFSSDEEDDDSSDQDEEEDQADETEEDSDGEGDIESRFLQHPKDAKGISLEKTGEELDEAERAMEQEAEEDMQLHIQSSAADETADGDFVEGEDFFSSFRLPTPEELVKEEYSPPNLSDVKQRIQIVTAILADFNQRRDPNRARAEYMDVLNHDLKMFYGYAPDLIDLFLRLFSPAETVQFLEANEQPRPTVIRVNTLKTRRRELAQVLINRGVNVDPLASWSKVGLKVYESAVPIGATPEYLSGHYMLQSASSFWPCIALGAKPGERILDMAAAPGGKTTYIGQMMKNKGLLIANDSKRERTHALVANLHRMGINNSIVCNYDGTEIPKAMSGFDRALLDAPCTGLGVISRDPSIKTQKTYPDVLRMAHLQKKLLLAAIDSVDADSKSGGIIVYSTCSVSAEENEAVVDYALRKRYVKLVPLTPHAKDKDTQTSTDATLESGETGKQESEELDVGLHGLTRHQHRRFHPSLTLTRRFYPHVHNMDGFFVAKLKKYANIARQSQHDSDKEEEQEEATENENDSSADEESNKDASEAKPKFQKKTKAHKKSSDQKDQVSMKKAKKSKKQQRSVEQEQPQRTEKSGIVDKKKKTSEEGASKKRQKVDHKKETKNLPTEMSATADVGRMDSLADQAMDTLTKKKEEAERKQKEHKSGSHLLKKFRHTDADPVWSPNATKSKQTKSKSSSSRSQKKKQTTPKK